MAAGCRTTKALDKSAGLAGKEKSAVNMMLTSTSASTDESIAASRNRGRERCTTSVKREFLSKIYPWGSLPSMLGALSDPNRIFVIP